MLQDVRKKVGLSQGQLAEKSGVSVRMIQNYEQGFRDIDGVKLSTLIDLAAALECSIYDVVSKELSDKLKNAGVI